MNRLVAVAIFAAVLLLQTGDVSAQAATPTKNQEVEGDIKGTIGLGLIGVEVGLLMVPSLNLHDKAWAWAVLPLVGGGAGVAAGVLAFEGGNPDPTMTVSILAVGVGLMIPAIVGSLSIASRRDAAEMEDMDDGAAASGPGLVRLSDGKKFVRLPALSIATRDNTADQQRFGVAPQRATALHVPLLSGRF